METVKVIVIVSVTFILHCSFFPVVVCPLENLRSSPEGYPHANLSSFPFPSLLPPLPQLISPCTMCTPSGCCTGWGLIHLKKYISGSLYFSWLGYRSICSSTTTTLCHCLCLDDGDCLIVFALEKKKHLSIYSCFSFPLVPSYHLYSLWVQRLYEDSSAGGHTLDQLVQRRTFDLLSLQVCNAVQEIKQHAALLQLLAEKVV